MTLQNRYNTEVSLQRRFMRCGEHVRAFVTKQNTFKPKFWGTLIHDIAAGKPVAGNRDHQHL